MLLYPSHPIKCIILFIFLNCEHSKEKYIRPLNSDYFTKNWQKYQEVLKRKLPKIGNFVGLNKEDRKNRSFFIKPRLESLGIKSKKIVFCTVLPAARERGESLTFARCKNSVTPREKEKCRGMLSKLDFFSCFLVKKS